MIDQPVKDHPDTCHCRPCVERTLDDFVLMGILQKIRNISTGEAAWLNAELPIPVGFERWKIGHDN